MLTIIVPVQQSLIKPDCFLRLLANLLRLRKHSQFNKNFSVVVADSSCVFAKPLIYLITKVLTCRYYSLSKQTDFYSPAFIKNCAAKYAFTHNASHVLYLDVDVLATDELIDNALQQTKNNVAFDWYPVCFLHKEYSLKSMFRYIDNVSLGQIKDTAILQTGYVTGLQLISRELFEVSNGYCEDFIGYGCEDIEFIHRASLMVGLRQKIPECDVYYTDDRGYYPDQLKGFRNFYYRLKVNNRQTDDGRSYHFWHPRKNQSNYLISRKTNDAKLINIMKKFDKNWI